jgi:hypothetical protein
MNVMPLGEKASAFRVSPQHAAESCTKARAKSGFPTGGRGKIMHPNDVPISAALIFLLHFLYQVRSFGQKVENKKSLELPQ